MTTAEMKFRALLRVHTKYDAEAYNLIYQDLDWTTKQVLHEPKKGSQHVTGQELCEGFKQCVINQFGCMALIVLECWNIASTYDIGCVVFNLMEFDLMGKQETDSLDDFKDVFNFEEEFRLLPVFSFDDNGKYLSTTYIKCPKKKRTSSSKK